jgi:Ring finger domain
MSSASSQLYHLRRTLYLLGPSSAGSSSNTTSLLLDGANGNSSYNSTNDGRRSSDGGGGISLTWTIVALVLLVGVALYLASAVLACYRVHRTARRGREDELHRIERALKERNWSEGGVDSAAAAAAITAEEQRTETSSPSASSGAGSSSSSCALDDLEDQRGQLHLPQEIHHEDISSSSPRKETRNGNNNNEDDNSDDDGAPSCAICFAAFQRGDCVCESTGCNHVFHKACILAWLRKSQNRDCPTCRCLWE